MNVTAGNIIEETNYDAWGRVRNPTDWTYTNAQPLTTIFRGYTGHEMLPEFDLINMNGRMYDPVLGRMLSPDNYVQDPTNPQNYNRYAYVNNNPLIYIDPSGNEPITVITYIIAGLIIAGKTYSEGVKANNGEHNPFKWNWRNANYEVGYNTQGGAYGGVGWNNYTTNVGYNYSSGNATFGYSYEGNTSMAEIAYQPAGGGSIDMSRVNYWRGYEDNYIDLGGGDLEYDADLIYGSRPPLSSPFSWITDDQNKEHFGVGANSNFQAINMVTQATINFQMVIFNSELQTSQNGANMNQTNMPNELIIYRPVIIYSKVNSELFFNNSPNAPLIDLTRQYFRFTKTLPNGQESSFMIYGSYPRVHPSWPGSIILNWAAGW